MSTASPHCRHTHDSASKSTKNSKKKHDAPIPQKSQLIPMSSNVIHHGYDSIGNTYASIDDLWRAVGLKDSTTVAMASQAYFENGQKYWSEVEETVNGVLGGFGHVANVDAMESISFIHSLSLSPLLTDTSVACDCGAGIGRVVKDVLLKIFPFVDLVEADPRFVEIARRDMGSVDSSSCVRFICQSIQNFKPPENRYSLIWLQWVCGHLPDEDFVAFLRRCKSALVPGGVLCCKENNSSEKSGFVFDTEDFCLTRTDLMYREIFTEAGFTLIKRTKQNDFPKDLLPVYMYALQVDTTK